MITRLGIVAFVSFAFLAGSLPSDAANFGVTHTGDAGQGSLRQAILDSNVHGGADVVVFNIPMSDANYDPGTGVWTMAFHRRRTSETIRIRSARRSSLMDRWPGPPAVWSSPPHRTQSVSW
jgi:hypothetical protein